MLEGQCCAKSEQAEAADYENESDERIRTISTTPIAGQKLQPMVRACRRADATSE